MANSIPASQLVQVIPGVLGAGGNPLSLNSVFVDTDPSIPIGTVQPFSTLQDVINWYGSASQQAVLAGVYFNGFTNAQQVPGLLYFTQYNTANVAAYLRGGSLAGLTLTQLQAFSGTIILSVNGGTVTSSAINLAAATSFSNAATLITAGLTGGSICTYDSLRSAFVITSPSTGAASTITTATGGTLSANIKLTAATGAVTSQGANAATPAGVMDTVTSVTQNWVMFMTTFEPILSVKLAFAAWVNAQGQRYAYVCWDSDVTALSANATGSFGALVNAASYNGCIPIYNPSGLVAAFVCGATGSIDQNETQGRITYAYKGQAGLVPDITNATQATNLIANGYNFYGSYATANQQFTFFQPGQISGVWDWIDPYINQIYLNSQFQLAFMTLLSNVKALPYNTRGYGLIRAASLDPINQALNFGSIQPGVKLSAAQAQEVNTAANLKIDGILSTQGWYQQINPASVQQRGIRGTPPITFWYTDGGSIQKISMASIDIQ